MVKLSTPALLSLLAASAAAADLRGAHRGAHRNLHRRGGYSEKPASYTHTFPVSSAPAPADTGYPISSVPKDTSEDTTCTEESTKPVAESYPTKSYATKTYPAKSTGKTYPASSYKTKTYPASTYETNTYETSTTPAESTSTTCTEESTSESVTSESKTYETYSYESKTYETSSTPAESTSTTCTEESTSESKTYETYTHESKTYATSVPATETSYEASSYEASSYGTSTPASETSYAASTYESESSPEATPSGETSTYWETQYSTHYHYQTLSGGSAYPSKPAAKEECGTVTITVTEGQAHPTYSAAPVKAAPVKAAPQYLEKPKPAPVSHESYSAAPVHKSYSAAPSPHTTAKPKVENNVGKRGVAYATIPTLNVGQATGIHWAHNWGPSPTGLPEGIEYVPMCKDESMAEELQQNAGKATYLMSFNEVDMTTGGGGVAMTPQQAAAAYKKIMMPYAGTHKLGAPSVTSDNSENSNLNGVSAASGLAYLKQFAEACDGCQVDFAALHWYGGSEDASTQAELFKTYMTEAIATVQSLWPGCKVWVDEFSASPSIDKDTSGVNKQFMEAVLPWLDECKDIERYSYFAATPGLMANADGSLTEIGQTYANN